MKEFCVLSAVAKVLTKIILEGCRGYIENLVDRERAVSALNLPVSTPLT